MIIARIRTFFSRGCRHKSVTGVAWLDATDVRLVVCDDCGLSILTTS